MKKEFIPYEQALALKELEFDEPCFSIYYSKDKSFSWHHHKDHTNDEPMLDNGEFNISAPLYQQAFRWFREKHKLGHMINGIGFETFIMNIGGIIEVFPMFKTYEEAELACLNKLIELIKTK